MISAKVETLSDEAAIRLYRRKAQEELARFAFCYVVGNEVCTWLRENCLQNAFPVDQPWDPSSASMTPEGEVAL